MTTEVLSLSPYKWMLTLNSHDNTEKCLYSDFFDVENVDDVVFNIGVKTLHDYEGNIKKLCMRIKKSSSKAARATAEVSMNGIPKICKVDSWDRIWQVRNFIIGRGSAVITCEIKSFDYVNPSIPRPTNLDHVDFCQFNATPEFTDVTIKVDALELPANKIILAAQSPVFLKMFTTDMKEAHENTVSVNNFKLDVMKEVLAFMYTNHTKAEIEVDWARKLLPAAEMYQISKLKEICVKTLINGLDVKNALIILAAADDYNAVNLREKTIEFMLNNKEKIATILDFKTMCCAKPILMYEFMSSLLVKK